jgi:hypothetical protein
MGVLSRVLLSAPRDKQVDHINHDPLDNRRHNIRLCTASENARNKRVRTDSQSRYKGVTRVKGGTYDGSRCGEVRRWRAYARVDGKVTSLGYHATEEAAALAYNDYASKEFGEFAYLNDVPSSV